VRVHVLAALVSLISTCSAFAADTQPAPSAVLASLSDRIYVVGETTGNVTDMIAAEMTAAEEIRRYIASGATDGLVASGKEKQSPLVKAAYMGFPNVVAALLTSGVVRAHMNDTDEMRMTPWIASTLSMQQSAWACNPAIFENPFAFIPMLVTQAYYVSNPTPPYQAARAALEQAGASPTTVKAKDVWSTVCKNQSVEGKARVQSSTDLQKTVQELGLSALTVQLQKMQKKMHGGQKR
jgi:hypothetical protein